MPGWPGRSAEDTARALAVGVDGATVDHPQAEFQWCREAQAATA